VQGKEGEIRETMLGQLRREGRSDSRLQQGMEGKLQEIVFH
jgi:hypothetical protein